MSRRRLMVYIAIFVTGVLALFGFLVFIGGLIVEFVNTRRAEVSSGELSPAITLALGGLLLAALMFALWFGLVALLIARQTRRRGPGYGDAYRLIEAFQFRQAIPLLERSIREGYETPDVLMLLTSAYAYSGQLAKASATADRAVELYPDDPGSYLTLANSYRLQAAYDSAADALRMALERAPEQPIIWAELGFVQKLAGDHEAALESFRRAADHAMPAMYGVRVHYHLAQAYMAEGDTRSAMKATARMMSAREGLAVWSSSLPALAGTTYGTALRYEIAEIEQALADADAGNLG